MHVSIGVKMTGTLLVQTRDPVAFQRASAFVRAREPIGVS